jgi:tRNA (mo5U34)-methyltransferase
VLRRAVLEPPNTKVSVSAENAASLLVNAANLERFWPPTVAQRLLQTSLSRARAQVLGDAPRWLESVRALRGWGPVEAELDLWAPRMGSISKQPDAVVGALNALCPWRKGPFDVLGVHLDAEWRCDMKWDRVRRAVSFEGKRVFDVGSGNGYYLFRTLGQGAQAALGIDPTWLYVAQFAALHALSSGGSSSAFHTLPAWVLPLGIEDVSTPEIQADIVLSMGVLYHRKSPIEHLEQLRSCLVAGGTLVLESLIVPGNEHTVLVPATRYARMRNVWMIPSVDALILWLRRVGFSSVDVADVSTTTSAEQRPSAFMNSLSLEHFLDPSNNELTVEGYPRPRRAVFVARR